MKERDVMRVREQAKERERGKNNATHGPTLPFAQMKYARSREEEEKEGEAGRRGKERRKERSWRD